jgi:FlaA1/EpsC-like NDP-sugar epimerase
MPISERGMGAFLPVTGGGGSIGRVLIKRRVRDLEET